MKFFIMTIEQYQAQLINSRYGLILNLDFNPSYPRFATVANVKLLILMAANNNTDIELNLFVYIFINSKSEKNFYYQNPIFIGIYICPMKVLIICYLLVT